MSHARVKTIKAGPLTYTVAYSQAMPHDEPRARAEKTLLSSAARQRINFQAAARKLQLLIACNFGWRDLFLTLTYDDDHLPPNRQAAAAEVKAWVRRLRAAALLNKHQLRYILITESVPDQPGGDKRLHHHVILNAAPGMVEDAAAAWGRGNVDWELLGSGSNDDFSARAAYMVKERHPGETGRRTGLRAWVPSRGLRRPVESSVLVPELCRPAPPPGCYVVESDARQNCYGAYYYLAYVDGVKQGNKR